MMNKWLLPIVIFIAPCIVLLAACEQQADIRANAYLALEQMHQISVQAIDMDIAHIDQFLTDVEDKEMKLEQIIAQVQQWIEQKKAGDYTKLPCGWKGHLDITATPEELAQIPQNNQYEITRLELAVYRFDVGPQDIQFTPTIEVRDLTDNQKYIVDIARQDLRAQKDTLDSHKQEKVAAKNLLLANLQAISGYNKDWTVKKYGKNAYSISGQGLGWADGKLTISTWDFRTDTGQMMPMDGAGLALFYFITSR